MKGVLFSVVEEVVLADLSEDAWDEILQRAGSNGVYASLGDYPDAELFAIIDALAAYLGLSVAETLVMCGRRGFAAIGRRHPKVVEPYRSWRSLIGDLNGIVHPEVRKIYPGAHVPEFRIAPDGDSLRIEYHSTLGLCRLAEGLMLGSGDHFGTPLRVVHTRCTHAGDDGCELLVSDEG